MPRKNKVETDHTNLLEAYEWFNQRLFDNELPPCVITFQRHYASYGWFWRDKFQKRRGRVARSQRTSEIALNPDAFPNHKDQDVMSTLVHEMVHFWQACFGDPGRGGYHNRGWANKMIAVGLMPSSTGRPGGAQTGDRMSDYVIRNGAFSKAWGKLYRTGFRIRWQSVRHYRGKDRSKQKFSCPTCGINVWGAETLVSRLACIACRKTLVAND